jgi:Na+/proline symporter
MPHLPLPTLDALPLTLAVGMGWVDWAVLIGYFVVVTIVGERLAGKQESMDDFFRGGGRMPWYAVAGSMIATEISAVTFVGVPAFMFGLGGDFTFLQLALIGGLAARFIIASVLVPAYYKQRVYSPYDYMGNQLGGGVRGAVTTLFTVGGVLAQASRVYLTAIILELVLADVLGPLAEATGIAPLVWSVLLIGVVSVAWTMIGGIATVIWTDVALFLIFIIGGLIAIAAVISDLDGGWTTLVTLGSEGNKFRLFDASISPVKEYTIWTAAIGTLFGNIGAYGTDQLLAQRIFTCRNQREAQKAVIASWLGTGVTALMLLVGVGLWAYYKGEPAVESETSAIIELGDGLSADELALMEARGEEPDDVAAAELVAALAGIGDGVAQYVANPVALPADEWANPLPPERAAQFEEKNDRIFPIFILSDAIPTGLTGLILAGIFAAAISSFDSILAALSQTTISAAYLPWLKRKRQRQDDLEPATDRATPDTSTGSGLPADGKADPPLDADDAGADPRHIVFVSRMLVIFWAIILCGVAFFIDWYQERFDLPILPLALGLASWVQGGLLAAFLLAWLPLGINGRGLIWAAPLSVLCVAALRFHSPEAVITFGVLGGLLALSWLPAALAGPPHLVNRRLLVQWPMLIAGCVLPAAISQFVIFDGGILAWPWWSLVGGCVAFPFGYLLADPKQDKSRGFEVEPAA